ncbi:MAG TPA: hypothetical protein VFJ94_09085 [Intrasporangium sp.]|uniref:PRC-barrel domain-containing protein n=1 Tax=Intrasporangium sp. TaxID=1925024 RepID=UPI002D7A0572|nr:hypothetical protein [Intrasporangium sp.]HET7398664.1 hypothetical protein [Intrasporangium sp.]
MALRLLDHQIVGPRGQLLGNVDDLELVEADGALMVTGLLVGPAALGERLPGRLGEWVQAVWRRLHRGPDEHVVVPMEQVTRVGSAVTVTEDAAQALLGTFGLELWLRRHVVSRIPGAKGGDDAEDPEAGEQASGERQREEVLVARPGGHPASGLLGARLVDGQGRDLGRVSELRCVGPPAHGPQAPLRVTHLHGTPHSAGARLGYGATDAVQGPALLAALWRLRHRDDPVIPVEDISAVDWQAGTVVVADGPSGPAAR